MKKIFAILITILFSTVTLTGLVFAKDGSNSGSGEGSTSGGGDDRVRIEVRNGDDDSEENRVRVEVRGDASLEDAINMVSSLDIPEDVNRIRVESRDGGDRVRVEVRGAEEELPNVEIGDNTFEITGEVTAFTGSSVTINGQTITIDPGAVANFEQEGTIEVGEVIKVEGVMVDDGTLLAREIKANGVEAEAEVEEDAGVTGSSIINQILTFIQSLV